MIIEKNVPIPAARNGKPVLYPFKAMQVGDSFFYEGKRSIIAVAASKAGKKLNSKFLVRAENGGYRVWRVE